MVEALLLGLAAALLWGGSVLTSVPSARIAGSTLAALWMSVISTAMTLIFAIPMGPPAGQPGDWSFVFLSGAAYACALGLWFIVVKNARISLITPVVACDGAFAALLAAATGASLSAVVAISLGGMVSALVVIAKSGARESKSNSSDVTSAAHPTAKSVMLGIVTAVCFGTVFFASGKTTGMNVFWVVALSRAVPVVCFLGLCLYRRILIPPANSIRWLLVCGVFDGMGYIAYVVGARANLPVAAVAASQYAAVGALGGIVMLGERPRAMQIVGTLTLIIAAAVIASQSG